MRKNKNYIGRTALVSSIAIAACQAPLLSAPVQAQALQPAVDVCTGISLNPSAVTDIVDAANDPLVGGLSTLTDNILEIDAVVGALPLVGAIFGPGDTLDITDLDLEIDDILGDIAAGEQISLTVLDTNGNLIAPSDQCNLTADAITLNEEGGIAIGGNQITGLGENGMIASAGEIDAIAFGNGATTAAGATGAIAIGEGASVMASGVNSVALGAGSVADRGPLANYTAPGLTGTFYSVGSVSVGSAGALRQITNVAPGTEATDAATVGQVQAALDAVAALDSSLGNVVEYDDATQAAITLGGTDGTTIANLADGEVSATSDEAVNGSQLFATNQSVAVNAGDINDLQTDVSDLQADVAANTGDIADIQADVAVNTTDIDDLQMDVSDLQADVAANTGDIADIQADVAVNSADIADLQDTAVQYDDASQASVTLGGADGTTVTNVADGALNAGSSDAVNGSQMFATNQQVDINTAAIQANTDAIAAINTSGDALGVTYDDATRTSVTLDGAGGTTIANVTDGEVSATSDEAVNGSQLFATNQQVDANSDAIDDLDGRVTVNEGDIANLETAVSDNSTDIANLDGRVTIVEEDLSDIDARVTVNEGNIANLDTAVTTNTTNIANIDDRVTVVEGDLADVDARVTNNTTNIASIDERVTVNEGSITNIQTRLDNVPVTYVANADPSVPSDVPTNTVAFVGATADPVRVTNVAAGNVAAGSTDAVNGSQLAATNAAVADNRTDIDQNTADIETINNNLSGSTVVAVQYSDPDNPTVSNGGTITNDVTLVGANGGQPVALHNLAAGTAATDAVNLGQLQAGMADVLADSISYTDQQFGLLSAQISDVAFDLEEFREEAFAGTAGAMAVAGIPQTMEPGRSMFGGAIGHYRGETAFAIGASTTFNEGRGVLKAGATVDTHGEGGFSAGAGISF
ncbi:YadA family autotransporter adhesin [Aurantiacibacter zhengii]|uniref:Trimeric autotransporter adhesin YadA-like C-terminal membrane anchor domain-containing protein n=1 Tax=Aurantiacibacter zhengii TaxID=2307003 RepID=A0A418NX42_9SPHN|nr:YadA-like family protein [Aurantiacibacter zhengii]RIV89166.1 hypothetical protein D2V07_02700 [Aurantiacibacter zhengii]